LIEWWRQPIDTPIAAKDTCAEGGQLATSAEQRRVVHRRLPTGHGGTLSGRSLASRYRIGA
jgi:hypothetical protein